MRILIISSCFPDTIANMYDEAYINYQLGKDVFVVDCNSVIEVCWHNLDSNKQRCRFCSQYRKKMRKKVPKGVSFIDIGDYCSKEDLEYVESIPFVYNSLSEIKKLEFMGVKIGYCCISIYFSKTRNNNPLIDDTFKHFFDHLLRQTALYTIALDKIIDKINPDQLYVFNGRCTNSRPGIELAMQKGIDYICSEVKTVFPGKKVRRYFHNAMPHSIALNTKMVFDTWEHSTLNDRDKNYLGEWFFESKIKRLYQGDKIYTFGQKDGLLPENWDSSKHNIVIFNSSEDEFAAIGDEIESKQFFYSQKEAIETISSLLEDKQDYHIYLKIHPNLNSIPYRFHTDLLSLGITHSNLTVIKGNSKISTYDMMKQADKVIVFGSTTGVEAVYQKKPVILLSGAMYYNMGFCYIPHTIEELKEMLLDKNLKTMYNENVIKMSYYWMDYFLPTPTFFSIDRELKTISFLGKKTTVSLYPEKTLLGSRLLWRYYEFALEMVSAKMGKHKYCIPIKERDS